MDDTRDLLLSGGTVHVFDDDRTTAEAVLFRGDRVAAVGDEKEVRAEADDAAIEVDLDGRVVLPGFNDAHAHLLSVGIDRLEADLSGATSREEALDLLREEVETRPKDAWVVGRNFDESQWPSERMLTRDELDGVSDTQPVAAFQVAGHAASVNSVALDVLDLSGVERDVRTDDVGEPTGILVEDAAGLVKRETFPRGERAREALALAGERALSLGVTSVQHVSGLTAPTDHGSPIQQAFFGAWREGELPVRITFYVHSGKGDSLSNLEFATGFGDEWLRVGGLKTFSDGALGAHTAKLSEPYLDEPDNDGTWTTDPEELRRLFEGAARANQQIVTHALGDEAIETVLSLYEDLLGEYPDDPRLRIEHVELATDDQLARMADAGVIASMQPNFLQWAGEGGIYERVLGPEARGANNRFRDVLDADVPLVFGSDTMPMGPLYGIHHAVNAPHDSQRSTVEEAIAAYTCDAAYSEFAEDEKGTLEPGMFGDAVVLDRDPFEYSGAIDEIEVDYTVVGGEVAFAQDDHSR